MREDRDSSDPRYYVLVNQFKDSPIIGTKVMELTDGGYETQDKEYRYFWWDEIETSPNWKRED